MIAQRTPKSETTTAHSPEPLTAVVGNHPLLMHDGRRAYFPLIYIGPVPGESQLRDSKIVINETIFRDTGGFEAFDRFAVMLAAASDMLAALHRLMPTNLSALPSTMPDSATLPLDVTFGELRQAMAAIAKAEGNDR